MTTTILPPDPHDPMKFAIVVACVIVALICIRILV